MAIRDQLTMPQRLEIHRAPLLTHFKNEGKLDLSPRELGLIHNCVTYTLNYPSGVPAHNLMLLISKLYAKHFPEVELPKDIIDEIMEAS